MGLKLFETKHDANVTGLHIPQGWTRQVPVGC